MLSFQSAFSLYRTKAAARFSLLPSIGVEMALEGTAGSSRGLLVPLARPLRLVLGLYEADECCSQGCCVCGVSSYCSTLGPRG